MKEVKIQNIYAEIEKLLKKDMRLLDKSGNIIKNALIELTIKSDKELLAVLCKDKTAKQAFFTAVNGTLIFDRQKFLDFVDMSEFLPKSYTAFENQIGLATGKSLLSNNPEVVLAFPYKDCILEGGQDKTDEKRDEIFYNTTLAPDEIDRLRSPKALTNWKKFDEKGEHPVSKLDGNENLIIRGNNLLALYSLLPKYRGQVKLIYIDPPYYFKDTKAGDTFIYNTNFKLSTWLVFMKNRLEVAREFLTQEGTIFVQVSDEGMGHIKLLLDEVFGIENFINIVSVKMKNIAGASGGGEDKRLKKNIEFIFIYSKNSEQFQSFKNIYDYTELYELVQEYKQEDISWKYTSVLFSDGEKKYINSTVDGDGNEIKIYSRKNPVFKSISQISKEEKISEKDVYYKYIDKIFTTAMPQSSIRTRILETLKNQKIHSELYSIEYTPRSGRNKGRVYEQFYKGEQLRLITWLKDVAEKRDGLIYKKDMQGTYWDGFNLNNLTKEGQVVLENGKKPEGLIERIIDMSTEKDDLIMDYHLGSGTTAAVAHKMGRRYIGIEQLDYVNNDCVVRLKNVISGEQGGISTKVSWKGGGSFVYAELIELNAKYIELLEKAKTSKVIIDIYEQMKEEAFFRYQIDLTKFSEKDFGKLDLDEQKKVLLDCIDANHLYINYSDIDDATFKVSNEDKKLNKEFYK